MSHSEILSEIQENLNTIKPQLEEILRLLNTNKLRDVTDSIEAAAAKIIAELKPLIQDYHGNKEVLQKEPTETQIISSDDTPQETSKPWRYSYPNFSVGNEDLGTGKNPGSLTWPFISPKSE